MGRYRCSKLNFIKNFFIRHFGFSLLIKKRIIYSYIYIAIDISINIDI